MPAPNPDPIIQTVIDPLLSRHQVAKILGISNATIKRYDQRGLLQPIRIGSRLVRYKLADVTQLFRP